MYGSDERRWMNGREGRARGVIVAGVAAFVLAWGEGVHAASHVLSRTFDDPTVTNQDLFGWSVAIDGPHVLIGAVGDTTNGFLVGQANLFDAGSGDLLHTFDDPTPTAGPAGGDRFGYSVAVDGDHVLIGAPRDGTEATDIGQAYLFDAGTGSLLHTFDDPTPTDVDRFGDSVAIDGRHVLIGASGDDTNGDFVGQAHLFDAETGSLLRTFDDPTVTGSDNFGSAVAIDGNRALIGAPGDGTNGSGVGQAHLFDAGTGSLLHTFDDPTVTDEDRFGYSVAIDGNRVLIGARGDDTNGDFVGQAHLFNAGTGSLLHTFDDPTVTGLDLFGTSVAIDGNRVLIGARGDNTNGNSIGQAHLFDAGTGSLVHTFDDPTVTIGDWFGYSVAMDGRRVLVGAPQDRTNGPFAGQAHLFVPAPGTLALAVIAGGVGRLRRGRRA